MKATIERVYRQKQTEGYFTLFNDAGQSIYTFRTLELPNLNNAPKISCIPEGIYKVVKTNSPSQGICFSVQNVPGRQYILIHKGNYAGSVNPATGHPDILGCILTASGLKDLNEDGIPEAINSKVTLQKLLALTSEFELTIRKHP